MAKKKKDKDKKGKKGKKKSSQPKKLILEQKLRDARKKKQEGGVKGTVTFSPAIPARVEEIIGRTGSRGEASQVRCRLLTGREKDKVMRHNVRGPVQVNDVLMLRETEIEARPLNKAGRGG